MDKLTRWNWTAGGGAYVFAKRQINAERQAKLEDIRKRKQAVESLEYSENVPTRPLSSSTMGGTHDPVGPRGQEGKDSSSSSSSSSSATKSKYGAQKPFVSPKGDRF
jgi:hypothetical protein